MSLLTGPLKPMLLVVGIVAAMLWGLCLVKESNDHPGNVSGAVCQKCRYPTPVERLQVYFTCWHCRAQQLVREYVPAEAVAVEETDGPTQ